MRRFAVCFILVLGLCLCGAIFFRQEIIWGFDLDGVKELWILVFSVICMTEVDNLILPQLINRLLRHIAVKFPQLKIICDTKILSINFFIQSF